MTIAVPFENGRVFGHFGHARQFRLYTVNGGAVEAARLAPAEGSGHGAPAVFLAAQGVEVLLCGGIGEGAKQALSAAGIQVLPGVEGGADDAVVAYLSGQLRFDPNVRCTHHAEGGSHCGGQGCSESCGG